MNDQERKRGHEEKGISVAVTLAKNENSSREKSCLSGREKLSKEESHRLSNIKIIILEGKAWLECPLLLDRGTPENQIWSQLFKTV